MMETQRGRQVPVVKDFHIEGSWAPATPAKPNVARPSPIYDDSQVGSLTQAWEEQETHLSRYTQQNNAQTLLAYSISSAERSNYPTTSNSVWDNGNEAPSLSGRINLQNGNGGGIQRRGLENHLPHWSSQGRRSVMSYGSNVGSTTSYPRFSSWDLPMPWNSNGGRENGTMLDHNNLTDSLGDFNTMSFGDLLGISEALPMQNNGGSTSNGMFSENWVSQLEETRLNNMTSLNNQDGLRQIHQQNNGFYDQGIQNDALSNAFWSNANSTPTPKHANGSTVFAPETPGLQQRVQSQVALDYSQQRIQNHVASEYTHQGANLNNQNVLQEHEVAAAMIDLQDHQNKINSEPIADSSPGKAAVAVEKTPNPDKGAIQDIDLNKTPQKKPRRRRYCPKVIRENKPKPTPKPKTPKPSDPKDTQVKRKYVRKSKTDTPSTVPSEEAAEPKPTEQAAKSCRKSLNFDLNGQATEHSSLHMPNCGLETEPQARGHQETANTSHLVYFRQEEELMIKTSISAYDLNRTMNQELREYMALPVQENGDSSDMKNSPGQKVKNPCSLSRKNAESYIGKEYPSAQNPICSPCASSSEGAQTRGSKRSLSYTTEPTYNNIGIGTITQSTPWQPNHTSSRTTFTKILLQSFIPEICKKKRTEKIQRLHMHSTSSFTAASEDRSQVNKAHSQPQVELDASKYYYCNPAPTGINGVTNSQAVLMARSEIMEQLPNSWADLSRLKKKRTKGTTRVRDLAPLTGLASAAKGARRKKVDSMSSQYPSTATLNGVFSCAEALAADTSATPRSKRRSKKQDSVSNNWGIVPYGSNPPTEEATGSIPALPWKKCSTIEELTDLLQQLDLNGEKRKISNTDRQVTRYRGKKQEQNKLVLYEQNGPIVPFEGPFNPIRKRRQRARVDLDDETTRVWRLLLENIDNEGINGTDEDKAKWWENERRVFRGRVDSFIARMRLVQGDRRFTPWKGSVLDSVIGVFLTQNVSDHLSSSAFMSMAARFPLKPESSGSTLSEEATSAFFVEPEICEPEESISWNEKAMSQPTLDRNSRVIYDFDNSEEKEVVNSKEQIGKGSPVSPTECSSEAGQKAPDNSKAFNSNSQTAETETACVIGDDKARDDASSSQQSAISSQNSIDSTNVQTVGMVYTSSESNSKAQFLTTSSKFDLESGSCFMELLKMAESQQHLQNQYGGMKHVTGYYQEAPGVSSSNYQLNLEEGFQLQDAKGIEMLEVESRSDASRKDENSPTTVQSNLTSELADQEGSPDSFPGAAQNMSSCYVLEGETMVIQSQMQKAKEPLDAIASSAQAETSPSSKGINVPLSSQQMADVIESTRGLARTKKNKEAEQIPQQNYASVPLSSQQMADVIESTRGFERTKKNIDTEQIPQHNYASGVLSDMANTNPSKAAKGKAGKGKKNEFDWDSLRREAQVNGKKPQTPNTRDSLDWEAVRHAKVNDIAETIKERGMNNMLAERIKDLLDRLVKDHGSIDMEWLRDIPRDKAKEYLLSFRGLGLKSVECVRLLTLHHLAFPVDTNVGRIAVRLGWVPLQPLPESLQLHLLEMYPVLESIQKYLWPRLCKLDQKTLYELHYHMITFGKVFCTKRQPNCNACPLRAECRHFASAFASARFALPGPEEKSIVPSSGSTTPHVNQRAGTNLLLPSTASWSSSHINHSNPQGYNVRTNQVPSFPLSLPFAQDVHLERKSINSKCEPIVEVPASPEQESQHEQALCDIEDAFYEDPNEIPTIDLNLSEFSQTLQNFMHANRELQEAGLSNALVSLTAEAASIPTPKLKNINRLRTEHHVYELPDSHPLLRGLEKRELDDPCSYLLAIWTPGETANSIDPPARRCSFNDPNMLCNEETCSYCSSQREADSQIVRGTLLIPTRTAMRGSFPLNGTYFQVNEVFADHDSSLNPIAVPRSWLWNLPRRTVYFGTSIPTIFRGLNTEDIQHCFWRGYVCVRGFDQKTRSPRPLMARLHFPASRLARGGKGKTYDE